MSADEVARGPASRRLRRALVIAAGVYLAGIWLEAAGAPLQRFVPRPLHYFMQVAKLFPNAVPIVTEYRAEAYSCTDRVWRELDVRPFFPLRADDKENRFARAMFFYRRQPLVMRALDDYLVTANDRVAEPIGGVLLMSLRIPTPAPGEPTEPYRRRPLAEFGPEARKYWYRTPTSIRRARCHEDAAGEATLEPRMDPGGAGGPTGP